MKLKHIKDKAKKVGVDPGKTTKKKDLIRAIQRAEGYTDCYGNFGEGCPYMDCCFRDDCIEEK